jgi:hypothetical protein
MNDVEIIPGVILPKNPTELNFFIALKKGFKDILINQNQPLFCLFPMTEKKLKINFNKDKINVKTLCECGGKYEYYNKSRHIRSLKHIKWIDNQEPIDLNADM